MAKRIWRQQGGFKRAEVFRICLIIFVLIGAIFFWQLRCPRAMSRRSGELSPGVPHRKAHRVAIGATFPGTSRPARSSIMANWLQEDAGRLTSRQNTSASLLARSSHPLA